MTRPRRLIGPRDPLSDPAALIRRVHGYVAYRMGDCADAEDATSETFARALRYKESNDASKGTPISWLIGIARRCVDESYRRPSADVQPPDLAAHGNLELDAIERLTLAAAVARLDERDRELIALRYGADLSTREIAKRLGATGNAVDIALHRARGRLRLMLDAPVEVFEQPAERNAASSR
jgi:RNA polymerase sigma-70 factor (ECF subfamily)